MQRKATKTTRGANADEKRFMAITKESDCIVCGSCGPSIVDHVFGATFKHLKVLIGHYYLLPLCEVCDKIKTIDGKAEFVKRFGPFKDLWKRHVVNTDFSIPYEVSRSIEDWGR